MEAAQRIKATTLLVVVHSVVLWWISGLRSVSGHGRLIEPPSRSSMWRYGYDTEPNYQDNQLYCGGFTNQWQMQDGRCGVCGDPWQGPRDNEPGGKYARGIIVRRYRPNSVIRLVVDLTAPHKGWFEFRLCPNNNPLRAVTHECLDRYLLERSDGSGSRYPVTSTAGEHQVVDVQLPRGLECSQCVLQWKYHAGNSWGTDENGNSCVGCGPQEEFYGCSDIAIGGASTYDDEYYVMAMYTTRSPTTTTTTTTTTKAPPIQQAPQQPSSVFQPQAHGSTEQNLQHQQHHHHHHHPQSHVTSPPNKLPSNVVPRKKLIRTGRVRNVHKHSDMSRRIMTSTETPRGVQSKELTDSDTESSAYENEGEWEVYANDWMDDVEDSNAEDESWQYNPDTEDSIVVSGTWEPIGRGAPGSSSVYEYWGEPLTVDARQLQREQVINDTLYLADELSDMYNYEYDYVDSQPESDNYIYDSYQPEERTIFSDDYVYSDDELAEELESAFNELMDSSSALTLLMHVPGYWMYFVPFAMSI